MNTSQAPARNLTLVETVDQLHSALRDYIEATYHISDPQLIRKRQRLLNELGVIRQVAYIESTPRYRHADPFEKLNLPAAALEILLAASNTTVNGSSLVRNPAYIHQAEALQAVLNENRSLVVTTGTGSGKTECFLLPILGRLADEAASSPKSFAVPAMRALILYPMNALVNDQLGRLRLLFGAEALADRFYQWADRPARFARYTSRTLYPGVRTTTRDQRRLKPIGSYYVETLRTALNGVAEQEKARSQALLAELRSRGKWPAKPDLLGWYGDDNARWRDAEGRFVRCVTLPHDAELLTRHEVLDAPPDVLVTNYSMLEYMLMRPLERPVFDATRSWLEMHPDQRFLLVVDEAHLYRGAVGTEVALLLRRLRERLGIPEFRLQVICTSASFEDPDRARQFAGRLTGKHPADFASVPGVLAPRSNAGPGTPEEADILSSINLDAFYNTGDPGQKLTIVRPWLEMRNTHQTDPQTSIYQALENYPPMSLLVNATMEKARRVDELGSLLFPGSASQVAQRAATALVALGSFSRQPGAMEGPGLLPSRVHAFFRGLPGLWVCMDQWCSQLEEADRGGPAGKLYSQPRWNCKCGARVFELFTCRHCGSAYCRAYTDSLDSPRFLWLEPGLELETPTGDVRSLYAIDILLAEPATDANVRPTDMDIVTGRLDPRQLGTRTRQVYLPPNDRPTTARRAPDGEFRPCPVCEKQYSFGRSPVQDHQTKGDEPFRALISRQVNIQQPTAAASSFAPMAGRKVLVFSDSRQTAARLAPNLQKYTTRDAVRPLLAYGFGILSQHSPIKRRLSLEESYLAILLASNTLRVRLRPPTRIGENFETDTEEVKRFLESGGFEEADKQLDLMLEFSRRNVPEYLLHAIFDVINNQYYGLESLALATIAETENKSDIVDQLPDIPRLAETSERKQALMRLWLNSWRGQWLHAMPTSWASTEVPPESGKFTTRFRRFIGDRQAETAFQKLWVPILLQAFAEPVESKFRIRGSTVTLRLGGEWAYCQTCRTTQRPFPERYRCIQCGRDTVEIIDPDTDEVFVARKAYYRRDTIQALTEGRPPVALIAAEHTAQLNDAQADEVFSEAEEHELLFQDVDLGEGAPAIDVLSCTTTMEVGIDIGALSGVALRNMPPARANYQQRAGRAGRRGRAVATVTAFASADSHDEHCFIAPDEMIRGPVMDPEVSLDNWQIARRHLTAFVLQEYLKDRLPPQAPVADDTEQQSPYGWQLFEVLGKVEAFKLAESPLNRFDFADWLAIQTPALLPRVRGWLPPELPQCSDPDVLSRTIFETATEIDRAIEGELPKADDARTPTTRRPQGTVNESDDGVRLEVPVEAGEEHPSADQTDDDLLDRLLYKGVLPRYAFPTDVATFHVFNPVDSTTYRPVFQYTPSQGLPIALSQYAPGKTVWVGGKEWRSGAIYSPMQLERMQAWTNRRLYLECNLCHYATTLKMDECSRGEQRDCPACGTTSGLGPARTWLRPPGFAHPWYWEEETSPDDEPPPSYATRAKLTAPTPTEENLWSPVNDRIRSYFDRWRLLVTNTGPSREGYTYCTKCGLIEPEVTPTSSIVDGHRKPYPDPRRPLCPGSGTTHDLVLGTDFISDVLLISLRVDSPLTIRPEYESTQVALRTLSEALTATACSSLGIDPGELQAEFRPALSQGGQAGTEAEIYIYDTLPGGAGFAQRAGDLGLTLFKDALTLLEECPANCDSSCYRCLRSYKNKFDHPLLDRYVGASLLRYLLTSDIPTINTERAAASMDILFEDLQRQGLESVTFQQGVKLDVTGFGNLTAPIAASLEGGRTIVLVLRVPFTSNVLLAPEWTGPAEFGINPQVIPVDELAIRRNLPSTSSRIIDALGIVG